MHIYRHGLGSAVLVSEARTLKDAREVETERESKIVRGGRLSQIRMT